MSNTRRRFTPNRRKMAEDWRRRIAQIDAHADLKPLRAARYNHYREIPLPPRKPNPSVTLPRVEWLDRPHPWDGLENEKPQAV